MTNSTSIKFSVQISNAVQLATDAKFDKALDALSATLDCPDRTEAQLNVIDVVYNSIKKSSIEAGAELGEENQRFVKARNAIELAQHDAKKCYKDVVNYNLI